ncbi:MAG: anti-sigma factor antagonist [Candidatus Eremiobacteraeota bacterium]|nr:anti-sigma factor antagonist [Candidatus Eremiobacteraeota bacterium]MBC5827906.1 anti-sigma factor antagonist [Candidatus Eremiobacteraeota bacterium]
MDTSIAIEDGPKATMLTIGGEVDALTTPALARAIRASLDRGRVHFVIDLKAVSYIDSCGLGLLISTLKAVAARRGSMRIVVVDARLRRLFQSTGLDHMLPLHQDVKEAVATAKRAASTLHVQPYSADADDRFASLIVS